MIIIKMLHVHRMLHEKRTNLGLYQISIKLIIYHVLLTVAWHQRTRETVAKALQIGYRPTNQQ